MKKLLNIFFVLSISTVTHEALGQEKKFPSDPNEVTFHTEDVSKFWEVFDNNYPKLSGKAFQKEYISKGSLGLQAFLKYRIKNGNNLSKVVKQNLESYQSIREITQSIAERKDEFYKSFRNLKSIYPKAVFPDIYFVIGAKNSAGTAFSDGLIIGTEMFGNNKNDSTTFTTIDKVVAVVAHESIHFQQNYKQNNSLLSQSIKEGAADFLCELITDTHLNEATNNYGNAHKKELWHEFQQKMNGNNYVDWLYSVKDKSRPNDLGYWIGYEITKAYYEKSDDKKKAIDEILNIENFEEFLKESGYGMSNK